MDLLQRIIQGTYKRVSPIILVLFIVALSSCSGTSEVQDIKQVKTITIGNQIWMAVNLDIGYFRNGDPIPQVTSDAEWRKAGNEGKPAWCYYNNDEANGKKYGRLYNWYAITDPRGLAPEGWHLPTDEEWNILAETLGSKAGTVMKSKNWQGGQGTGDSGFEGLPGGNRNHDGSFHLINNYGVWWSATASQQAGYAWFRSLTSANAFLTRDYSNKAKGLSVRLLKD
jgi:uncharacterized protein (TIGR02145 family)